MSTKKAGDRYCSNCGAVLKNVIGLVPGEKGGMVPQPLQMRFGPIMKTMDEPPESRTYNNYECPDCGKLEMYRVRE